MPSFAICIAVRRLVEVTRGCPAANHLDTRSPQAVGPEVFECARAGQPHRYVSPFLCSFFSSRRFCVIIAFKTPLQLVTNLSIAKKTVLKLSNLTTSRFFCVLRSSMPKNKQPRSANRAGLGKSDVAIILIASVQGNNL